MNEIIPRTPIDIRLATMSDLPFIDGLQKANSKCVGFLREQAIRQKIDAGQVLIAETMNDERGTMNEERKTPEPQVFTSSFIVPTSSFPLGYCISTDRYMKHDNVGIIYQLNVVPEFRRSLVGAALIQGVFERAAYGCRLFCCWCAKDIEANRFWESIGFVPLAFRAGSRSKGRVHIFWQKRICAGDDATPYWYPFQTSAGAIQADRLVFPIPPGVGWKDVEAVVLPGRGEVCLALGDAGLAPTKRSPKRKSNIGKTQSPPPGTVAIVVGGRIKYIARPGYVAPAVANEPATAAVLALPAPVAKKPKRPAARAERNQRIDPKYLAAARELRDRYLEQYIDGTLEPPSAGLLGGKYEVARTLSHVDGSRQLHAPALPASAPKVLLLEERLPTAA